MSGLQAVIIADDLTGALDSAAPFAALGLRAVTATRPEGLPAALALAPQVLAVTLNTREGPEASARDSATLASRLILAAASPRTLWLKKIDSRLKGHVRAETQAIAAVLDSAAMLICPAIPELGRIVRNYCLQGAGVSTPIPLPDLGPADAETDADLDRLVATARPGTLFIGARGLAAALARQLCHGATPAAPPAIPGPIGFVIGSRDPVTLAQVAALHAAGLPVTSAPDGIIPDTAPLTLVQATPGPGAEGPTVSHRLALGVLARPMPGTLLLSGGETAAAFFACAGVETLTVLGEVLPGLPLCHAPGLPALITKSGGFGPPDTLLWLWLAAQTPESCPCP